MTDTTQYLDALKWRALLSLLDEGNERIAVVLRESGRAFGGTFAGDGDEIVEHMLEAIHEANPEGVPYEYREFCDAVDKVES